MIEFNYMYFMGITLDSERLGSVLEFRIDDASEYTIYCLNRWLRPSKTSLLILGFQAKVIMVIWGNWLAQGTESGKMDKNAIIFLIRNKL